LGRLSWREAAPGSRGLAQVVRGPRSLAQGALGHWLAGPRYARLRPAPAGPVVTVVCRPPSLS